MSKLILFFNIKQTTYSLIFFQDGTTPLILASANGHVACVKELLEQGADPSSRRHVSFLNFFLFEVVSQDFQN